MTVLVGKPAESKWIVGVETVYFVKCGNVRNLCATQSALPGLENQFTKNIWKNVGLY